MTVSFPIDEPAIITLTPLEGTLRRIRLEPTTHPDAVLRIEHQLWRGCHWHTTGGEYIAHVELTGACDLAQEESDQKTTDLEVDRAP